MDGEPKTKKLPQLQPFSGFASLGISLVYNRSGRAPRQRSLLAQVRARAELAQPQ